MLLERGIVASIVGVDISAAALSRAGERCRRFPVARFVRGNLAVEAPDGPFDLIVCAETLYYLGGASASAACALLTDRVAPDGRIVAVHPASHSESLHHAWTMDSRLTRERRECVSDAARPYVIEVFRRDGDTNVPRSETGP